MLKTTCCVLALLLSAAGCSAPAKKDCKPAHGEVSFEDADGNTELFANLKFSIRRVSDGKILYKGVTDIDAKAKWQGGCEGDKYLVRQDGFLDAE